MQMLGYRRAAVFNVFMVNIAIKVIIRGLRRSGIFDDQVSQAVEFCP